MDKMSERDMLSYWLVFAASLRMLSVVLGYFWPSNLLSNVFGAMFTGKPKEEDAPNVKVSNLLARVFAVWTLVTCMITLACAFRLDSFDIVAITTASFAIALSFFLIEWAVFGTMLARNLLGPGIIAGVSVVWLIRWMYMHHGLLATV